MLAQAIECMTRTIATIMFGDPVRTDITAAGWANVTTSTAISAAWTTADKRNTGPGVMVSAEWYATKPKKFAPAPIDVFLAPQGEPRRVYQPKCADGTYPRWRPRKRRVSGPLSRATGTPGDRHDGRVPRPSPRCFQTAVPVPPCGTGDRRWQHIIADRQAGAEFDIQRPVSGAGFHIAHRVQYLDHLR